MQIAMFFAALTVASGSLPLLLSKRLRPLLLVRLLTLARPLTRVNSILTALTVIPVTPTEATRRTLTEATRRTLTVPTLLILIPTLPTNTLTLLQPEWQPRLVHQVPPS